MSTRRWLMLGGAVVVVMVALVAIAGPRGTAGPSSAPTGSGGLIPAATVTAAPSPTAAPTPSVVASSAPPAATVPPRASGAPGKAYAEFLQRVNADRTRVDELNQDLTAAVQAQDPVAARRASVAILDFVDGERDWLREHPPADCYATAHTAAGAMLDAYGSAADRFIRWADTGGGLAGLAALGEALDAAQVASDALTAFGGAIEATACVASTT
jgi:hypothetical protein